MTATIDLKECFGGGTKILPSYGIPFTFETLEQKLGYNMLQLHILLVL